MRICDTRYFITTLTFLSTFTSERFSLIRVGKSGLGDQTLIYISIYKYYIVLYMYLQHISIKWKRKSKNVQ